VAPPTAAAASLYRRWEIAAAGAAGPSGEKDLINTDSAEDRRWLHMTSSVAYRQRFAFESARSWR
jgi:hypothetical protein